MAQKNVMLVMMIILTINMINIKNANIYLQLLQYIIFVVNASVPETVGYQDELLERTPWHLIQTNE